MSNSLFPTQNKIHELIDLIFDDRYTMYKYQIDSYHQFINEVAFKELEDNANLIYENITNEKIYKYRLKFTNIQLKPPMDETSNDDEILFPEDARIKFLTYSSRMIADIKQVQEIINVETNERTEKVLFEDKAVTVAKIPIMFRSNYCSTMLKKDKLTKECPYDPGCYFIIKGSEKVVMSQERMIDNKILVFSKKDVNFPDGLTYYCQINCKKLEDLNSNLQIISIKLRKDYALLISLSHMQEIPVYIIFKALGIISDKTINSYIMYNENDTDMSNILKFSMNHYKEEVWKDASGVVNFVRSQDDAINYLLTKIKIIGKRFSETNAEVRYMQQREYLLMILERDFLHHMGPNLLKKGYFLGLMCNKLINCFLKRIEIDDRDSMINKRIDTPGILIGQLFRQYYKKLLNDCTKDFRSKNISDENPMNIISQIKHSTIEQGINSALATGNWGNSKKKGVAQMLQRMTYMQLISALRRVITPQGDASSKLERMRFVHNTQYGFIDPIETPEHGHSVGTVKQLSNPATISSNSSSQPGIIKNILADHIIELLDLPAIKLNAYTKVFVNGEWLGMTNDPLTLTDMLKQKRFIGEIERFTSIAHHFINKTIRINTEAGRLIRPLLRVENNRILLTDEMIDQINIKSKTDPLQIHRFNDFLMKYPNVIEYVDPEEQETLLISFWVKDVEEEYRKMILPIENPNIFGDPVNRYNETMYKKYSHCELHPSMTCGNISANVPFAEHNDAPRNYFNFSQARQALGIYATNYRHRVDLAYNLYYPQIPLVYPRGSKYTGLLDLPYGQNCVVAIAMYTGYNQEDSIIMNQSSIERGLFRAESFRKESDEIAKNPATGQDEIFAKPDRNRVAGMKDGNYDKLNEKGYMPEESIIKNNDVIIGKITPIQPGEASNKVYKDSSMIYKSGVDGVIDKVYTGIKNADGYEMYNMKIRQERVPRGGDKFCYTDEHDVLTTIGWINIKDITVEHKIACLINGDTLQYNNPVEIQDIDWKGRLYNLKSNQVELRVTDNHRMYVADRDGRKWHIKQAKECYGKRYKYKKNVENYTPENPITEFILPGVGELEDLVLDLDAWLIFFGIWIAEGSMNNKDTVCFAANKPRVKEALEECCEKLNFKILKNKDKVDDLVRNSWRFYNKTLAGYIGPLSVGSINKQLPDWVWDLNQEQCRTLIHGMMLGDGHTMANGTRRYDTSSTILADHFQRLCLHAGWSCNKIIKYEAGHEATKIDGYIIKSTVDAYRLTIIESQNTPLVNKNITADGDNRHDEFEEYEGKVYCCTVPGDGIIYVRKNGYCVWSGNSSRMGQKGTIGTTLRAEDMPFTAQGIRPDIIINTCCLPTRMTIGQLLEALIAKTAALEGRVVETMPFDRINAEAIGEMLKANGFNEHGLETMYCGFTGKKMEAKIFICPTYYLRLKHLVQDKIHCLDKNHDVLTLTGWKPIAEINMTDQIATLKNNMLVYEYPIAIMSYPDYEGDMYYIKNQSIDLAVTGNHRMLVSQEGMPYDFEIAKNLVGKNVRYKNDAIWEASDYQFNLNNTIKQIDMNSWLTFFGVWFAKGWLSGEEIEIAINKQIIADALYSALEQLDYMYNVINGKIIINNKELFGYITTLSLGSLDKKLPEWVFKLCSKQVHILINAMLLGDESSYFYTTSSILADQIQQLCLHAGWSCIIQTNDYFRLKIIKTGISPSVNHVYNQQLQERLIHEKCPVFCLQVPSEIFYVRRNGKPVWTGNSRARGPVTLLTHQPPEGRARDGGLRFGEMERDVLIAHGIPLFLKEKFMDSSDGYMMNVCADCGLIAHKVLNKDVYICDSCKTSDTHKVQLPYAFKLMIQELMAINILPRIRVEDNEFNNSV